MSWVPIPRYRPGWYVVMQCGCSGVLLTLPWGDWFQCSRCRKIDYNPVAYEAPHGRP